MRKKPRILVFASGSTLGGGSGFQEMTEFTRTDPPVLDAEIVGVVSNYETGGVFAHAKALNVPFYYWAGPYDAAGYRELASRFEADFVMLSGWLKKVTGLSVEKTINIHPGPLPGFGGQGMFGHHVHESVLRQSKGPDGIRQSAVTMHFVDDEYDHGPIICRFPILLRPGETSETLARRVNEKERTLQSIILNLVVRGKIYLHKGQRVVFLNEAKCFQRFSPSFISTTPR